MSAESRSACPSVTALSPDVGVLCTHVPSGHDTEAACTHRQMNGRRERVCVTEYRSPSEDDVPPQAVAGRTWRTLRGQISGNWGTTNDSMLVGNIIELFHIQDNFVFLCTDFFFFAFVSYPDHS